MKNVISIILGYTNLLYEGFRRKFEHGTASLHHVCKHEEVFPASRLSHVRILQVDDRL